MQISLNKATLIGRLGKDPEKRSFNNGGSVVSFSLATSESWKDKESGEWKDRTEWHNIQIFNETKGTFIHKHARKGDMIYVEGKIQNRKYQDQQGNDRYVTEIVVQPFFGDAQIHKPKDSNSSNDAFADSGKSNSKSNSSQKSRNQQSFSQDLDDDIPF